MAQIVLSEVELCRRVVKFLGDYKRDQKKAAIPFYLVARKFGKLCSHSLGRPLQEVMEDSGLFYISLNEMGGAQLSLRADVGTPVKEVLKADEGLQKLLAVQQKVKASGVAKPTYDDMAKAWTDLYNEPYPYPRVDELLNKRT